MPKKKPIEGKPEVHKDLDGLDFKINKFGEIKSSMDLDKLNQFLNENLRDKKLNKDDSEKK
jgi:hypothetical protein